MEKVSLEIVFKNFSCEEGRLEKSSSERFRFQRKFCLSVLRCSRTHLLLSNPQSSKRKNLQMQQVGEKMK